MIKNGTEVTSDQKVILSLNFERTDYVMYLLLVQA